MIKALALDNFWIFSFAKTKKQAVRQAGAQSPLRLRFAIGLIAVNVLLLMSYIYGVNEYASSGYQIKALQKNLVALNESNRKLNLKISEAGSMVAIQSDFLNTNFVSAGTPKFLQETQLTQR